MHIAIRQLVYTFSYNKEHDYEYMNIFLIEKLNQDGNSEFYITASRFNNC